MVDRTTAEDVAADVVMVNDSEAAVQVMDDPVDDDVDTFRDAQLYAVGQQIRIWSRSSQTWFDNGRVVQVHDDGALEVTYDVGTDGEIQSEKFISVEHVSREVRPLSQSMALHATYMSLLCPPWNPRSN